VQRTCPLDQPHRRPEQRAAPACRGRPAKAKAGLGRQRRKRPQFRHKEGGRMGCGMPGEREPDPRHAPRSSRTSASSPKRSRVRERGQEKALVRRVRAWPTSRAGQAWSALMRERNLQRIDVRALDANSYRRIGFHDAPCILFPVGVSMMRPNRRPPSGRPQSHVSLPLAICCAPHDGSRRVKRGFSEPAVEHRADVMGAFD
jgi:hypothetical protein